MQAIVTKCLGPTNSRGAVIKATCDAGSICVAYDYAYSEEARHALAAMALVRKLGWTQEEGYAGRWVSGSMPQKDAGHYAFVFCPLGGDGYLDTFGTVV